MNAYKCDACGKFFENNRVPMFLEGTIVEGKRKFYGRYDLCENCADKVRLKVLAIRESNGLPTELDRCSNDEADELF